MKIHQQDTQQRSTWLTKPLSALAYQGWLVDRKSLTMRLQNRYKDFNVKPVSQGLGKPFQDEMALLHLGQSKSQLIRNVLLMGNGQPVVYAHSILPLSSMRGEWHALGGLGRKPLGGALFKNPRVVRTPLRFKKLSKNHALYQRAVMHLSEAPTCLWARRSVFSLNCAKILVTEVFLPNILHE